MKPKEVKKVKDQFSKVRIKPRCKFEWDGELYEGGKTLVIPTISVKENIHKIIKEV